VLAIQTVIPIGLCYLTFVCENKQGNHCNLHKSFKELRLRKVLHYLTSLKEEKTFSVLIPLSLLPKNHNLFANIKKDETEGGKKRKIHVHSLIMQKYNTQGRGVCEEKRGRGQRLLNSILTHQGWI
jgi:hypothetical protein